MSTTGASSSKQKQASPSTSTPTDTLLSTIHQLTAQDVFHNTTLSDPHSFHPFTANDKDAPLDQLADLQNATTAIIESLKDYTDMQVTDSKFVSILKQFSTIAQNIHFSERETRRRAEAFRERPSTMYGEPIPLDQSAIVDWAISRFEEWARNAGMETFKDESTPGHVTMMLGGKMLVLDVDFAVKRPYSSSSLAEQASSIRVASVKTSHALPSDTTTNAIAVGSGGLDDLIKSTWNHYLDEIQIQRGSDADADAEAGEGSSRSSSSSMRAAQLRQDIQRQMQYLLKLDALAVLEGDTGIRWFNDVGNMNETAQRLVSAEARVVASSLSSQKAPLDIFLARGHALPMPYLSAPFMSFLVYTSPLAYNSILQSWNASQPFPLPIPTPTPASNTHPELLDIPSPFLRKYLLKKTARPSGAVVATLSLEAFPAQYRPRADPLSLLLRPNFQLLPEMALSGVDHLFLDPTGVAHHHHHTIPSQSHAQLHVQLLQAQKQKQKRKDKDKDNDTWVLDFTDNGNGSSAGAGGIVVSQSRMREIQLVIDPDTSMHDLGLQNGAVGRSWVSLLLNPTNPSNSTERFVAIYKSPSNAHPPLRLRLTPPDEAGFLLGKVPVRTLKEVWGVLEVVRDQCWLNETLRSCAWIPETAEDLQEGGAGVAGDASAGPGPGAGPGADATEEELNAILNGTYPTRLIPVSVSLPYASSFLPSLPLFPDPDGTDPFSIGRTNSAPRISMSVHTPRGNMGMGLGMGVPGLGMGGISSMGGVGMGSGIGGMGMGSGLSSLSLSPSLVQINVTHDPGRVRGVRVEVGGTLPMTVEQVAELEEGVRRGGVLGLAGRVWRWEGA